MKKLIKYLVVVLAMLTMSGCAYYELKEAHKNYILGIGKPVEFSDEKIQAGRENLYKAGLKWVEASYDTETLKSELKDTAKADKGAQPSDKGAKQ